MPPRWTRRAGRPGAADFPDLDAPIAGQAEPLVSALEGAKDVAAIEAIVLSARLGRVVEIDASGLAASS